MDTPNGAAADSVGEDSGPVAEILVDPAISRAKFDHEVSVYQQNRADWVRRGWWLLDATFPDVLVAFVAPQLRPRAVIFGARINFDNYDLWAPSVRLVDPFTGASYRVRDLPPALKFVRRVAVQPPIQMDLPPGFAAPMLVTEQPLLQFHGPDDIPFLCFPGVREYHAHPAHTADDWLLHRDRGEGTLYFLLEKLARYGLEPINSFQFGLQIVGFARGEAPE